MRWTSIFDTELQNYIVVSPVFNSHMFLIVLGNSTFSEYGHVAYQIKRNCTCSNIEANILRLDTSLTPGVGPKGQNIFFLKVVMLHTLHIKLKGTYHKAHILGCVY